MLTIERNFLTDFAMLFQNRRLCSLARQQHFIWLGIMSAHEEGAPQAIGYDSLSSHAKHGVFDESCFHHQYDLKSGTKSRGKTGDTIFTVALSSQVACLRSHTSPKLRLQLHSLSCCLLFLKARWAAGTSQLSWRQQILLP